MSNNNNLSVDSVLAINEGFTHGGDLILRSTDGLDFNVHSVLLSLASPVFSELLQIENRNEVIRFSENAEVLSLTLRFIYPRPTPIILSTDLLNHAMRVADKYQLDSMKIRLREQLVHVDSPVSVYNNPLSVLYIASAHGFTAEAELAASLASRRCDFGKGDDLKQLLDAAPIPATKSLVKLTGIPLVKTRILMEVLFCFERAPMTLYNGGSNLINALACVHCISIYKNINRQSPPEWQMRWARWIFEEIKDRQIAEWKDYFSHSNFNRYYDTVVQCVCINKVNGSAEEFQSWANGVYEHLKYRLAVVAEFETQI
ncbi:hypothetical protein FRC11_004695 [Ceratobasidium sp. 423]|nr:hypothetical protein FRC11_004695 [Ceratobasidium sp. 423]